MSNQIIVTKKQPQIFKTDNIWWVESSTRAEHFYHVKGNGAECDCPDFIYRRMAKGQICKHINAVFKKIAEESEFTP